MSRKRHKSDSDVFTIPSHQELDLPTTQCREPSCSKNFQRVAARKKHETDKHRYNESKGTTVCPESFPANSELFVCPSSPPRQMAEYKRRRTVSLSSLTDGECRDSLDLSSQLSLTSYCSLSTSGQRQINNENCYRPRHNQCPFCLFEFQSAKTYKQHTCQFEPPTFVNNRNGTTKCLSRPKNWKKTLAILSQLRDAI